VSDRAIAAAAMPPLRLRVWSFMMSGLPLGCRALGLTVVRCCSGSGLVLRGAYLVARVTR
jgi:hypothetical protein